MANTYPSPAPSVPRYPRHTQSRRGAVMVETVLITFLIMIVVVLFLYLGWSFRRLQRVTNMDRYEAWRATTPVTINPGLDLGLRVNPRRSADLAHQPLNETFYGDIADPARQLTAVDNSRAPVPQAHRLIQEQTTDETPVYLEHFYAASPTGRLERFEARHNQSSPYLAAFMSDLAATRTGHRRLDGDWRYSNGLAFNAEKDKWEPAGYHVIPRPALREVFFAGLDDALLPYTDDNGLAAGIRDFYTAYPRYRGPDLPPNPSIP